ncbi:MAG: hypothetical protein LBJ15_02620 [Comamonas sp.]|uniref:hypothetical protein n=1 Tax=Comamonas sp. TaxID=34028 RepID=UPI002831104A|nr:hypothetical protein [Comamonas sp.]MDR0212882.1 hypothetical protein [Comamonas sp.]
MQILGAYSMHAVVEPADAAERIAIFKSLTEGWLKQKGSDSPDADEGEFRSQTGDGTGLFSRTTLKTAVGELHELNLDETASNGDLFSTRVSMSYVEERITVFATLGAAPNSVSVTDGVLHPKCPAIIRSIIRSYDDWSFNEQLLPTGRVRYVSNEEEALDICDELRWKGRSLPMVLVSSDSEGVVWPKIADDIAVQLTGLAEVVEVDRDAAWTITDELKKAASCYLGAVRLYWPDTRQDSRLRSQLWTSERQDSFGKDEAGRRRFLSLIRKTVLTAAALTISEPRDIKEVRRASSKERLATQGVESLKNQIVELQERIAGLEANLASANAIQAHTRHEFEAYRDKYGGSVSEEAANDDAPLSAPPVKGDTRYYKKISSGGGVDRMVYRLKACNHNAWVPAFAGDQAEKGIEKLEGRKNWRSLFKCRSCDGGGFWKVNW